MVLRAIDRDTGRSCGEANVAVEFRPDGTALLQGPVRLPITRFVKNPVFIVGYAWAHDAEFSFELPKFKELNPMNALMIDSVEFGAVVDDV